MDSFNLPLGDPVAVRNPRRWPQLAYPQPLGAINTPVITPSSRPPTDEDHQRMLANMGIISRGPSPGFAAEHPAAAAALPQFNATGDTSSLPPNARLPLPLAQTYSGDAGPANPLAITPQQLETNKMAQLREDNLPKLLPQPINPLGTQANPVSTQSLRQMYKVIQDRLPGDENKAARDTEWNQTAARWGANGQALVDNWQKTDGQPDGSVKTSFLNGVETSPAQPKFLPGMGLNDTLAQPGVNPASAAPGEHGGVVQLPTGEIVAVDKHGGRSDVTTSNLAGNPIAKGPPLPAEVHAVMGPQLGMTPLPRDFQIPSTASLENSAQKDTGASGAQVRQMLPLAQIRDMSQPHPTEDDSIRERDALANRTHRQDQVDQLPVKTVMDNYADQRTRGAATTSQIAATADAIQRGDLKKTTGTGSKVTLNTSAMYKAVQDALYNENWASATDEDRKNGKVKAPTQDQIRQSLIDTMTAIDSQQQGALKPTPRAYSDQAVKTAGGDLAKAKKYLISSGYDPDKIQ